MWSEQTQKLHEENQSLLELERSYTEEKSKIVLRQKEISLGLIKLGFADLFKFYPNLKSFNWEIIDTREEKICFVQSVTTERLVHAAYAEEEMPIITRIHSIFDLIEHEHWVSFIKSIIDSQIPKRKYSLTTDQQGTHAR